MTLHVGSGIHFCPQLLDHELRRLGLVSATVSEMAQPGPSAAVTNRIAGVATIKDSVHELFWYRDARPYRRNTHAGRLPRTSNRPQDFLSILPSILLFYPSTHRTASVLWGPCPEVRVSKEYYRRYSLHRDLVVVQGLCLHHGLFGSNIFLRKSRDDILMISGCRRKLNGT